MIRFDQVYKRYANGREALAGVSFSIGGGELAFLTGHSGAGKSSILKLIALIERPTRGQVFINQQNTASIKPRGIPQFRKAHRRGVPGSQAAARPSGGRQRRAAAHHRRHAEARDRQARARGARSGRPARARRECRPLELSTGEQQRVGIARAVVAKPKLLIADEPTGNLDPDLAVEIMQLFKRFNDVGVTVVIATHDVHLIDRFAARRIVLDDGRVVSTAPDLVA